MTSVSQRFAEGRIEEKISSFAIPRARQGLAEVDARLKARGVPAHERLHYISAVVDLSRIAERTLPDRKQRAFGPSWTDG